MTISPVLLHGPQAIWAHLDPIQSELRKTQPTTDVLHFYSDGPTTQYKNKLNFYFFSTRIFDFGFRYATWNFFEAKQDMAREHQMPWEAASREQLTAWY